MNCLIRYSKPLVAFSALAICTISFAEVEHKQVNPLTTITYVSDDGWQPENFDNGTVVSAAHMVDSQIKIDGKDDEIQWRNATEVTVPLSYGDVKEVSLKALYTNEEVFIRLRWPDASEDRHHHPWIWNPGQQRYVEGPQIEDSVLLSFEAGCEWTPSLMSGYIYDFDAWHWLAARSDPIGQALDLYGNVQDRPLANSNFGMHKTRINEDQWQLKFIENHDVDLNAGWDGLDRVYIRQPVTETVYIKAVPDGGRQSPPFFKRLPAPESPGVEEQVYPQFSPVKLTGGAGEVSAKGTWEDGYWTVEFKRVLITDAKHIFDTIFNRLVQFSVHVFNHTEDLEEVSESGRLFLKFEEPDLLLVKK